MKRKELLFRGFLTFLFMMSIIVLSKIKLHPIFGTTGRFSLLTMFGPIIPYFVGSSFGALAIFGARILQILVGISGAKDIFSYIIYTPIFIAGFHFAKMFRKTRKQALIPGIAIVLFLAHPIGRQVWYYSLFWTIPIAITLLKPYIRKLLKTHDVPTIYLYALSATFVDHAVGSVLFLYYLNIPAVYWNLSIPYVPIERLIYALGILIFYLFTKTALESLQKTLPVKLVIVEATISPEKSLEEPIKASTERTDN